jgi:hypothetical protein
MKIINYSIYVCVSIFKSYGNDSKLLYTTHLNNIKFKIKNSCKSILGFGFFVDKQSIHF